MHQDSVPGTFFERDMSTEVGGSRYTARHSTQYMSLVDDDAGGRMFSRAGSGGSPHNPAPTTADVPN